MSLMDRVQENARELGHNTRKEQSDTLEELKAELQKHLSSDEIATLMAKNPRLAKNEIKSVCKQIFSEGAWVSRSLQEKEALVAELLDTVFGLGPLEGMLADESITEIMVNGSSALFFERAGRLYQAARSFSDDDQVRALIDRIIGPLGRRIDEASPMVNARLRQGHRVNAIIPPLSLDGPILTIRKFREHLYTLEEMEGMGTIERSLHTFLVWAVLAKKNIAVSGGTGSGKTTFLNALSCIIPPEERIITIEDSAELKFSHHPHVIRLEARPQNAEGVGEISIRELVINALRMRPDRIIVGECRGGEALDMLQAMNTGHDGSLTTLHANSPGDAVIRLSTMVRYAAELPIDVIEAQVASAINLVIQTCRAADGRRYVTELGTLAFDRAARYCEIQKLYLREHVEEPGRWLAFPDWIDALPQPGVASDEEVEAWKRQ